MTFCFEQLSPSNRSLLARNALKVCEAALRKPVLGQLKAGWSAEQIASRLRRCGMVRLNQSIHRFIQAQICRYNNVSWRH